MTNVEPIRPTPELHRHHVITLPERGFDNADEKPARVETQTHIDRYELRGQLCQGDDEQSKRTNEAMAEAGRRYYRDAYYGGAVPIGKSCIGERLDRSPETLSERYEGARHRRAKAILALGEMWTIIEWVCVDDNSPRAWAIKRGEHPAAGIALLRVALRHLAKHYGLIRNDS